MRVHERMYTPWGLAQEVLEVGDGVWMVSTASHGGFYLEEDANGKIPEPFRKASGWYEGDVEGAIPMFFLSRQGLIRTHYPHASEEEQILKDYHPDAYMKVFGVELTAEDSRKIAEREFKENYKDALVVVSTWGSWNPYVPAGMFGVWACRGGRSVEEGQYFLVPREEYKEKRTRFGFVIDPARHPRWIGPIGPHI